MSPMVFTLPPLAVLLAVGFGVLVGGFIGLFVGGFIQVMTMDTGPDWLYFAPHVLTVLHAAAGGWAAWELAWA